MKYLMLLLIVVGVAQTNAYAQDEKPQTVYSIIKVYKDFDWYAHQYNLWEKETQRNKKSPDAWVNLYTAARMAKITAANAEITEIWYANMRKTIERMEKAIPNTYEYYALKAWDTSIWEGETEEEQRAIISYALKAYELNPERPDVYPDLMNYYVVKNNKPKAKEIAKKWSLSNDISANILALNYNMLMSTEKGTLIITAGDNDTYPALVLQHGENIRPDVTVMNIFLAEFSIEYRNNIFKELGIPTLAGKITQKAIIEHIIKNKADIPLYFAFGNYFGENEMLKDNLYNVGLAFKYCEKDYNSTSVLINNFENKFLLDHLKFSIHKDEFPEQVKRHNQIYIPGLILLHEHYQLTENKRAEEMIKRIIIDIASGTELEYAIKQTLGID